MHSTETPSFTLKPTQQEIAAVAFELYQARGCGPGQELDDWFQAEQLLTLKLSENGKTDSMVLDFDSYPTGIVGGVQPLAPREHSGARDGKGASRRDEIRRRKPSLPPTEPKS